VVTLPVEYPELAAATSRFRAGEPRAVTVGSDGARVVFLRSPGPDAALASDRWRVTPSAPGREPQDALWVFDVAAGVERLVADPSRIKARVAGRDLGERPDADLPEAERALRERLRLSAGGIGSYATDPQARLAAFPLGGGLVTVDLTSGPAGTTAEPIVRAVAAGVVDPRPDPTGRRVAYVSNGTLRVLDLATDEDTLLAGEEGNDRVTWGLADFIAAEEFHRYRGYWWSPDGTSVLAARVDNSRVQRWHLHDPADPAREPTVVHYPSAGTANAEVTLHLLDLDGGWVDVHWDRETYPYLVSVAWSEAGGPLVTVLRRLQQHGLVLSVDPRTGETQVHAELADPRWVEPVPGTPAYLPDGRVLIGGELAHDGFDARCLFADGGLLTPAALYVRRVCGRLGADVLVEASEGEPGEQHLFRVGTRIGAPAVEVTRLTTDPGWYVGHAGGETLVIGATSLDHPGTRWTVHAVGARADQPGSVVAALVGTLTSYAAIPPYAPRPLLERVTDRGLPAGVLYPRSHVGGRKLPVLVDIYGGPGHQEVVAVRARWLERQWFADAGFAVVSIDNRGTPGVAPSFEKVIHRRLADIILGDQVDGLLALADKHPDLDLARVAIRGWSFGGWLAALAVLRRPDVYRCAIVGAPVTDWSLYDTAYTERYLGLPTEGGEIYGHNSLLETAAQPPLRPEEARPMLVVHGLADDNVVAAHTLRLSAALLTSGRPHAVIPLTGATHMAAGGVAQRLLRLELDYIRHAL
jgi:dipeptidyl-peptidase-4